MTAGGFFDREDELGKLRDLVRQLLAGSPTWLAIVGPRNIGRDSAVSS